MDGLPIYDYTSMIAQHSLTFVMMWSMLTISGLFLEWQVDQFACY